MMSTERVLRVMAVVPAHNEEQTIKETIESLVNQTYPLTRIVVVLDNCTDGTEKIARRMQGKQPNGVDVDVFCTRDNAYKKPGAINQYLERLAPDSTDILLLMDADTHLAPDAVERGLEPFSDKKVAAVCSKAGVKNQKCEDLLQKTLYLLQQQEYAVFDSQRVQTESNIKVVHGMAALHRWSLMQKAGLYNVHNLTEDYFLTLVYKKLGYRSVSWLYMRAWTEVPLTISGLLKQRLRWYRGGIDALAELGWNRGTWKDILSHVLVNCLNLLLMVLVGAFVYLVIRNPESFAMHWLVITLMAFSLYDRAYRIRKYIDRALKPTDWFLLLSPLPMIYGFAQTAVLYQAYLYAALRKKQSW